MTKNAAKKIAERVWANYKKTKYTFSHSLTAGRFKKSTVTLAIEAINKSPKNELNQWNPTKEQFIESFVSLATNKNK